MAVHPVHSGRRRLIIIALVVALLAVSGAVLHRLKSGPRPLLELAPQSALLYVEIRDLRALVNGLKSTRAWATLSPLVANRSDGGDSFFTMLDSGWSRLALAAGSQVAVVMTGFELDEERFTPHVALILSAASRGEILSALAKDKLPQLATRMYGEFVSETDRYRGVEVTEYRHAGGARRIIWASVDGVLLVANRADSMRAVIDTYQGQRPSLAASSRLFTLRQVVEQPGQSKEQSPIFGLVGSEAMRGLLARWERHSPLTAGPSRLADELLKTGLSALSFTLAFAISFEDGEVVNRYVLGFDSHIYEAFSASVNSQGESETLALIPQSSRSFTIYRFADLSTTARALERLISTRASVVTSIAVRELLARMKNAFGLDPSDVITEAIGNEVAVVDTGAENLLFIVAVGNKPRLAALIGKRLTQSGARTVEHSYQGVPVFSSSKNPSEAYCFLDDYVLIGSRDQIKSIIKSRASGTTVSHNQTLVSLIRRYSSSGFEVAVSFDQSEVAESLTVASRWLASLDRSSERLESEAINRRLSELPPSIRISQIRVEGVYSESRSPLGIFSTILSMMNTGES